MLKYELQGPKGLIKLTREDYLENTKAMAGLAFKKLEEERGEKITNENMGNIDDLLIDLLKAETEIYKEREPMIINQVIPYYYKNYYYSEKELAYDERKFPEVFQLVEDIEEIKDVSDSVELGEFIEKITEKISPAMDIISFSQKQSAKTRVGESLQNHLGKIFNLMGVMYDEQIRIGNGKKGAILDFAIPDIKKLEEEPSQVINIECQTTLKDRFRLTLGKITTEHARKYLATATGINLITKRDSSDLSLDKIYEIVVNNNTTLVVFAPVKQQICTTIENYIKNNKGTNSISVEEAKKLQRLSKNKIIDYSTLITKEVNSVLNYWKEYK